MKDSIQVSILQSDNSPRSVYKKRKKDLTKRNLSKVRLNSKSRTTKHLKGFSNQNLDLAIEGSNNEGTLVTPKYSITNHGSEHSPLSKRIVTEESKYITRNKSKKALKIKQSKIKVYVEMMVVSDALSRALVNKLKFQLVTHQ